MADASSSTSLPGASVIIPSRGRPELLLGTVRSILEGSELPAELIVVDQSDAPNEPLASLEPGGPCRLRYQWTSAVGASRARNIGIGIASHDILVFTDDDVLVTREWFGTIVRALMRAGERTIISGRVLGGPQATDEHFAPSLKEDVVSATYAGRIYADVLFSGNMALFRSVIADVGAFDERLGPGTRFPAAEDNDLGYRLLEGGYRISYEPAAALHHLAARERRDVVPLYWAYARGQGAFYAKHARLRDPHMVRRLRRSLQGHARELVRAAVRERRFAADHGVYILGLLTGATGWLLTQRVIPVIRRGVVGSAGLPERGAQPIVH